MDTNEHDIKSSNIWINTYFNYSKKEEEGFLDLPIYSCIGWFKNLKTGEIVWLKNCNDENEEYRFLGEDNHSIVLDLFETDKKEESTTDIGVITYEQEGKGYAVIHMSAETTLLIGFQANIQHKEGLRFFKGINIIATILSNPRDQQDVKFGVIHMLVNKNKMTKYEITPNDIVLKKELTITDIYKYHLKASDIQTSFNRGKIDLIFELEGRYGMLGQMTVVAGWIPNLTEIKMVVGFENK